MKKFRKIMAVLVAAIMIISSFTLTAFADPGAGDKITISIKTTDVTNTDTLVDKNPTAETYFAYKIFDYTNTTPADSNIGHDAGEAGNVDWGIAYTIKKSSPWITKADLPNLLSTYLDFKPSADGSVYNVTFKDGKNDEASARAVAGLLAGFLQTLGASELKSNASDGSPTTLSGEYAPIKITAANQATGAKGHYLITSSLGSNLILATTNIAIEEKNDYPSVDKKIVVGENRSGSDSVAIGDTVKFELKTKIPGEANQKVVLHDSMSAGLTLVKNSFTVKVNNTALTPTTEYTVTYASAASVTDGDNSDYPAETYITATSGTLDAFTFTPSSTLTETLRIELTDAYVKGLDTDTEVVITYDGILNENAVLAGGGNSNTVQLTYSNFTTPEKQVLVKTYNGSLFKHDDKGNTLGTAQFTGVTNTSAPMYFTRVASGDAAKPTVYKYSSLYTASTENVFGTSDNPLETPASGAIIIVGLDNLSYTFTEVSAPNGYRKLETTQVLQVVATDAAANSDKTFPGSTSGSAVFRAGTTDTNNTVTYILHDTSIKGIENVSGKELPSTGGMGTTVLYIVGGMLVILAGAYLFFSRKRTA